LARVRKILYRKVKCPKLKLLPTFRIFDGDANFKSLLQKAFNSCQGNNEELFQSKMKYTLQIILSSQRNYSPDKAGEHELDIYEYIARVSDALKLYSARISGKEKMYNTMPLSSDSPFASGWQESWPTMN
jgi:hypothetical protein